MAVDVRERAEAVVLQFENPVRMIECLGDPNERHRTEANGVHRPSLSYGRNWRVPAPVGLTLEWRASPLPRRAIRMRLGGLRKRVAGSRSATSVVLLLKPGFHTLMAGARASVLLGRTERPVIALRSRIRRCIRWRRHNFGRT